MTNSTQFHSKGLIAHDQGMGRKQPQLRMRSSAAGVEPVN